MQANLLRRASLLAAFGSRQQRNHAGQRHSVEQNAERGRDCLAVRSPVGREKAGRHQRINLGVADLDGDAPQPQPLPLARFPYALCRRGPTSLRHPCRNIVHRRNPPEKRATTWLHRRTKPPRL